MRSWKSVSLALGVAIAMAVTFAAIPASAEDTGVFKNSRDISRAQRILVTEGLLAPDSYTVGELDDETRQALSNYQSEHALNMTRTLDDETFQTLLAHEEELNPDTVAVPLEPAETAYQPEPEPPVQYAKAPPEPEPTPSTAEEREAPAEPEPSYDADRTMPATASPLPLLLLGGAGLVGSGLLILRRRSA
ncbi:MAG TPA: hypothetical protein VGR67_08295 [Candidatus Polarisedimenticolia bacterium]|jgi:hypothetical protein|nr:hypothetical protein [Candidatus Polarisedimenticolia bacterium]